MTESQSEWIQGLESQDDDSGGGGGEDGGGGKGVLTLTSGVQSYNRATSDTGGFHSDGNGEYIDEMQVGKHDDDKRKHLGILLQEQDGSNCDLLMLEGESKELSSQLNHKIMETRLEKSHSSVVTENNFGKEAHVHNDQKSYLDNGTSIKRDRDILPPSHQHSVHQKPGVILLGRGNSFSLGRSEVILLHNRPKAKSLKNRKSENIGGVVSGNDDKLVTISESRVSVNSDDVLQLNVTQGGDRVVPGDYQTIPSSSPPSVSNGLSLPDLQQTVLNRDNLNGDSSSRVIELVPCYEDDLQNLWLKAESMMARRNDKVRKILEEFGIGEPGGGGGEDENYWEDEDLEERKKEEEEVWQIIQES